MQIITIKDCMNRDGEGNKYYKKTCVIAILTWEIIWMSKQKFWVKDH